MKTNEMKLRPLDPVPEYLGHSVRVLVDELNTFNPWFLASDVVKALGLNVNGVSPTYKRLLDEEKCYLDRILVGMRAGKAVLGISESGFYKMVMRSNKPEAAKFQRWVCSEVLPSIRRTGCYQAYADADNNPIDVPEVMVDLVRTLPGVTEVLPDGTIRETDRRTHIWEYVLDNEIQNFGHKERASLGRICRRLLHTHELPVILTWETYRRRDYKEMKWSKCGVYPIKIIDMAWVEYIKGMRD